MKSMTLCMGAMALAVAATVTVAAHGESFSQPGDPSRWYEPSDTPAKRYAQHMKEAGAALKEAIAECRNLPARTECEREARSQYRIDTARARDIRDGKVA